MIFGTTRTALRALAVALALAQAVLAPATASAQTNAVAPLLRGTVVDSATGLPLGGASVSSDGPTRATTGADRDGKFTFASLTPGLYALTARADGYAAAVSDQIAVLGGTTAIVTLNLQRVQGNGANLRTIGSTSTKASASLQKASVLYQQVNAEQVTEQGLYRLGDALRQLPGIVNGGSDTAAPADDLSLNFRGIGSLETLTLIDGHPVGYGLQSQYNFDISPAPLFHDVLAVYGSGADQFYPVNAIGGVFDFQTVNPTPAVRSSFQQQYGTFDQIGSVFTTTGTIDKVGYAFVVGAQGIDGPIHHESSIYSYGASQDPGATGALRDTAFYDVDESSNTHTLLGKLTFPIGKSTKVLLSGLTESFFDSKAGNGDLDFRTYADALASGRSQAGTASSPATYNLFSNNPNFGMPGAPQYIRGNGAPQATNVVVTCPTGTLPLFNSAGIPSGTYTNNTIGAVVNGVHSACVTPAKYAAVDSGLNGAGTAFQTYNLQDYHTRITQTHGGQESYVDGYVDNYNHHYDRDLQRPWFDVPGDNPNSYYEDVINSGLTVGSNWTDANNSTGIGLYYNNAVYSTYNSPGPIAVAASQANDFSAFLRESYKFPTLPVTLYGNVWQKNAGETNTSFIDPRAAVVVTLKNDVFRVSAGESSTQPYLAAINSPFIPAATGSFNGNVTAGPGGTCSQALTNPISIGSSGTGPGLRPERGIDTEFSYGHRFFGDSQIQATVYNTNVFGQIYGVSDPLSSYGTGGIDPTFLSQVENVVRGICGQNFDVNNGLGVSAAVNLGHVRAQGIEISGRQRLIPKVAVDYDYGTDAVTLVGASPLLLSTNGTLIPGSQLPNVPLHQYNLALNYEFVRNANLRFGYHHISDNNTKNLGPYGYADAELTGPVGPGRLAIAVNNLFNSEAFYQGLQNQGVPTPTNAFAGGVPQLTERFGLPFRSIDFTYTIATK